MCKASRVLLIACCCGKPHSTRNLDAFILPLFFALQIWTRELLRKLRIIISVVSVDEKVVDLALNSKFTDFEDGLQYFTARENDIKIILTRNVKDYKEKELLIQTPEEYLKAVNKYK